MSEIKTIFKPNCYLCGSNGTVLYKNLSDKLFYAPGQWDFFKCINKKCNLIWLNPMPSEEDISIAYKDYYTHTDNSEKTMLNFKNFFFKSIQAQYLSSKYGYNNANSSILKNLLYLDPYRLEETKYKIMYLKNIKGKLLDIGCGNGVFMDFMTKHGWETMGIDFDEKAVDITKSKNLNVKLGGLKEQHFPSDYFDAITLSHVIEHIYNPISLLKECYRILKKTGKVVISTPNNQSLGHKYFKNNWRGLEPPRHIHIFSPISLIHLINLSGFKKFTFFTSSRAAEFIYMFSSAQAHNKNIIDSFNNNSKVKGKLFFYFEWFQTKLNIACGEELIIIAEKT